MLGPVMQLQAPLTGEYGERDELGEIHLTEEGMILAGYTLPTVGLSWSELHRLLKHPYVQAKLEEAWFEDVLGG